MIPFNFSSNLINSLEEKLLSSKFPLKKDQQKKHKKKHQPKTFTVTKQSEQDFFYTVNLHSKYQLNYGDNFYDMIELLVDFANIKKTKNAGKIKNKFHLEYFPSFEFSLANCKMEEEKCTICLCEFQIKEGDELQKQLGEENEDDVYMLTCLHKFHLGCLKNLIGQKDWAKCPVCSTIFGTMVGDQPQGFMTHYVDNHTAIPGHGNGAITIMYRMMGGIRNGKHFSGTTRTAYLPDNKQGREVFHLLRLAFARKLIFTVGRSVTSGLDNQTVWNGIHHKTSIYGGSSSFGYPDQTYLSRVKQELAAKGITSEEFQQQEQTKMDCQ